APSLAVIQALEDGGASVSAFDPEGMAAARPLLPGVEFATSPYEAAEGAAALVIVTEWDAFRALDLTQLRNRMTGNALVDLRNIYRPEAVEAAGFAYTGVGRGTYATEELAIAAE
ncbi:MAG TPA: UDP binding domain-containing protein, partial [Sphingomonas sp.]|nr:UDP binding domain-containing protein [Sphingomonas sp.]